MEQNLLLSALLHRQTVCSQAIAVAFTYRFACRPKGVFRHSLLRLKPSDTAAGLIRIEDFDLDRMYLIIGQKRAALIDAGWGNDGDLPALCHALTGGLPVDTAHCAPVIPTMLHKLENLLNTAARSMLPMLTNL